MTTDDRTETITDRAAIRDSDEPSERGDFPYYDLGPATSETVGALDLDAIEMNAWKYGTRPPAHTVAALVSEVRQLRFREQSSADAAHANYVAAEAAEDALARVTREAEALRAKVAAVEAKRDEFADLLARALPAVAALARVEALGDNNPDHADTCGSMLTPGAGYPCSCWQADLRAALATGEGK